MAVASPGPRSASLQAVPPLRIALYSGVIFERDAVSRSLIHKLELLERLRDKGFPVQTVAFTQFSDVRHESIRVVPDLVALLRQPEFEEADIHIFEYAMRYEIFNAMFLTDQPVIVVDHNTTPARYVEHPETKSVCIQTSLERENLSLASRIVTDGEYTRDQLLELDMEPDRLSVLHLPPTNSFVGRSEHTFDVSARDGLVRLLYVGRLVPAKGIHDLLDAVQGLWDRGIGGFTLTLAGSRRYSDARSLEAIGDAVRLYGNDGRFVHVVDATDKDIALLFGESDALVMPSYHEGYCVPVVEAMTSGCYVIGSDAGNLPNIMGGLGSIFEVGDVVGMMKAIEEFVAAIGASSHPDAPVVLPTSSGPMALDDWHRAVARQLKEYSLENYERTFLRLLGETLGDSTSLPSTWWKDLGDTADDAVIRSP